MAKCGVALSGLKGLIDRSSEVFPVNVEEVRATPGLGLNYDDREWHVQGLMPDPLLAAQPINTIARVCVALALSTANVHALVLTRVCFVARVCSRFW